MKSKFYLGLMALAALSMSSCSKDQVVSQAPEANNAIAFDSYLGHAAQTKGDAITSENIEEFKVYGYLYKGTMNWDGAKSEFMPGTVVSKNAEGAWEYTPLKYWPIDQGENKYALNFYAYAPINPAVTTNAKGEEIEGKPAITYTLNTDISEQVDFIYAKAEGQTKEANSKDGVKLTFKHALSKVNINASTILKKESATIKVNSLSFKAVQPTSVTVEVAEDPVVYKPADGAQPTVFSLVLPAEAAELPNDKTNMSTQGSLFLIPNAAANAMFSISYTVKMADYEETFKVEDRSLELAKGLEAGKEYTLNISIKGDGDPTNPEDFEVIDFTVDVTPWENADSDIQL